MIAWVTAYCACALCCPVQAGRTESGVRPVQGITVAGPAWVSLGTRVYIPGVGRRIVQDRMALRFRRQKRFDVYFDSHREAARFGIQQLVVTLQP